jgi:hypothetical protein
MVMPSLGTRSLSTVKHSRQPGEAMTKSYTRDVGMTKNITASITFGGGNATGANGTFPTSGFQLWDPVLIEGANLNNGVFTITALDSVNQSYLTLDPPPKVEGPITVTLRTP